MVAVAMFHVTLRQAGPEFDRTKPLEEQTLWHEYADFMNHLVTDGHAVLGGPLPDFRTAHAMEASSEEVRELWTRDPWYESHLILESVEPWDIRLDSR